jgi:hypothetical protein
MPFPLIPVGIGLLAGVAAWAQFGREKTKMTPERQKIYDAAIRSLKDPAGLEALGIAFKNEGLHTEGNLLLKRAALRQLTPVQKAANRAKWKSGMASKNPKEVLEIADEFEERGATGAAAELRKYARGLLGTPSE